jgi:hypothetical protein
MSALVQSNELIISDYNQKLRQLYGLQPVTKGTTEVLADPEDFTMIATKEELKKEETTNIINEDEEFVEVTKGEAQEDSSKNSESEEWAEEVVDENEDEEEKKGKNGKMLRKAAVAVGGGAIITAGVPLIPVLCVGEVMIVGGMALLATEFDSAKTALQKGRDKLAEFAENGKKIPETGGEDADDTKENMEELDELDEPVKVERRAVKLAKQARESFRKSVKDDILPLVDKYVIPE